MKESPMKIPEPEHSIQGLIDKHHEAQAEPPRPHMGCSQLGHPCDRWLWLSFRWAVQPKFPGRILRLFRRGQMEEATIVSDLRAIGMDVRTSKQQARVDFGAHVSGSIDAVIESGVPAAPKKRHVAEFKTHGSKSFAALEKAGSVASAKPEHFVQMQLYMHGLQIDRALYVAVCKDDDRIYTERVRYEKDVAERYIERGRRLALEDRMPPPISTDPSWYQCKFCDAHRFCHDTLTTQHVNCRTCSHSTAKPDSAWRCERHKADGIPVEFQRAGCDSHVLHPDLVPWQLQEGRDEWTAVYLIDGYPVGNGQPGKGVFSSRELLANPKACASDDAFVASMRAEFGGKIVG
jgi:hypothetical protein